MPIVKNMFFVGYIFSGMVSQKWMVLFAFLALFTFIVKAKSYSVCLNQVIQEFQETVNAFKNSSCIGKSPDIFLSK